jgi:hypothetical protein
VNGPVYLEFEFVTLVLFSVIVPGWVFVWLVRRRKIARVTVSVLGLALMLMAGVDAILLQRLGTKAKATPELVDDHVFASEFSIALYLLPLAIGGIGMSLMSHVLCEHVIIAELAYEKERNDEKRIAPNGDNLRDREVAAGARGKDGWT